MNSNGILSFLIFLFVKFSYAADTTCEESEKQFANLCFSPTPAKGINFKLAQSVQPADGWYITMTNDIARLHFAELVQGKLLTLQDNFEGTCFRVSSDYKNSMDVELTVHGYTNMQVKWNCNASMDHPGVQKCYRTSVDLTKYHENFNFYVTYWNKDKAFQVAVLCFPNGQVGWYVFSLSDNLSAEDKKSISDHIKTLGFSDDNTVTTYDDNCPKKP